MTTDTMTLGRCNGCGQFTDVCEDPPEWRCPNDAPIHLCAGCMLEVIEARQNPEVIDGGEEN